MKSVVLSLFFLLPLQSEKLVKVQVNDQITLKIPESFSSMTMEDQQQRVQSYRKPLAIYSSMDRYVELGVNIAYSKFRSSDLEILRDFYKASLANLFTEVKFHSEEITEINGRPFVIFSFTSLTTDVDNTMGESLTNGRRPVVSSNTMAANA